MIKPFEFIKVLVSSVCTVPNARNTRRSTALGETPLIWYCARYPEPSNPAVDSVSVGCGCGMQRGSVHCCVLSFTFQYNLLHAQLQLLLLPLCRVFPNSFRGIGGLEGIQVFKRGKVFEVPKSFAAISNNQKIQKIERKKTKRQTSSGGHRVWTEERSMAYIAQCNSHMKVKLCCFFPPKTG